jgi:oxygen-independent coproporphyrinogen-3 oxidase
MTSLRTSEGLSLEKVAVEFGAEKYENLLKTAGIHLRRNHLVKQHNHLVTTRQGKLLADGIASDLFIL